MAGDNRLVERWDGQDYERHSAHQRAWGSSLLLRLPLRGDERVLDLGCGDGSVTCRLAARVPRGSVLGIDAASEMLAAARTKCGPNMTVQQLDITRLAFEAEFDVVFSNAALHWVHDHTALLANIHRALKPGGALLAQLGCEGNCPHLVACLRTGMQAPPFTHEFAGFRWPWVFPSPRAYEALLAASPFVASRVWTEEHDQRFPTPEALVGWIDNPCLIPFVQALPDDLRKPFRDAVVAAMLARTRQPDGAHVERFRRIDVWARRAQ